MEVTCRLADRELIKATFHSTLVRARTVRFKHSDQDLQLLLGRAQAEQPCGN